MRMRRMAISSEVGLVESGERVLDQLGRHARPARRERFEVIDHRVDAVCPLGRKAVGEWISVAVASSMA
jgi:hypothetical protein